MTNKGKLAQYFSARARAAQADKDWDEAAKWLAKMEQLYEGKARAIPGQLSFLEVAEGERFEAPAPLQGKLF